MDPDDADPQSAPRPGDGRSPDAANPRFWMANALCRAAINRRVTGNPHEWPLEWFARMYGPRKTGLSLGCGTGSLERSVRRLGICESVVGVDVSPRSLDEARERAREEGIDGLIYVEGNLNRRKLPRNEYDVVFVHHSLHSVVSLAQLLGRVARALRPEGLLFLAEWTGPAPAEWRPAVRARPAALFAEIPRAWRRWPEFRAPLPVDDPSAGVRSSDILPTLDLFFDPVEIRPYGGQLTAPLTAELDASVEPGPDLDGLLAKWLEMEDEDLRMGSARSYHHVVVARPLRGLSAVRGRAKGLAGRVRLALRYRVPSAIQRVRDFIRAITARRDPLIPPGNLLSVGIGDYRTVGEEFLRLFREDGLLPNHRVLDVGCGTGRMAMPLSGFLGPRGSYEGFDVSRPMIVWCRRAISRRFPAFRFTHADVSNSEYNPDGQIKPRDFAFPYRDDSFDFIFATSLFTHLLPEACARYVGEIARVLAPGGRCFLTAFLLNERSRSAAGAGLAAYRFEHWAQEAWVEYPNRPEAVVAHDEGELIRLVTQAGLSIVSTRYGDWTGSPGLTFQDVVVCRKGKESGTSGGA